MKKKFLILIAILILFVNGFAQKESNKDKSFYYSYGEKLFAEAYALPTNNSDSLKMIVCFRIMNDALTFSKYADISNKTKFLAIPIIEIECKDSEGIIRNRIEWSDSVIVNNYDETDSKKDFIYGYKIFSLNVDNYTINVDLYINGGRKLFSKKIDIQNGKSFYKKPNLLKPIIATKDSNDNIYKTFLLDYNTSFVSKNAIILIPFSYENQKEISYNYTIDKIQSENNGPQWDDTISLSGEPSYILSSTMDIDSKSSSKAIYLKMNQLPSIKKTSGTGLLNIELPDNGFVPGSYTLKLISNNKDTTSYSFKVIWVDMPLSLRNNVDYSVDVLYYILTDDEYDEMDSGSDRKKFRKLLQFWNKKDPTPETPYNEEMAQYYQRVDYAFFNFQTVAAQDGALTDRGKIYILYGKPDKVNVDLKGNKPKETWVYDKLKKEFVFEVISTGVYKLISINE